MSQLAILGYHKIGPPPANGWESWFYIPEKVFDQQLDYLSAEGWEIIDQARLLQALADPSVLPEKAALLSFDDGYRSMREVTLPLLRRRGYPAVLFVPTDYIGGSNTFDGGSEPDEPICDWEDLRELQRCGVSVQSHSVSHPLFSLLSPQEIARELRESKEVLESGMDRLVELFAYPYGDPGRDPPAVAEELRASGYRAAFLYGGGPNNTPFPDPYGMTRLAMGPDTDLAAALRGTDPADAKKNP